MGVVLFKILQHKFHEVIPTAGYRGRGFSSGQGSEKKYVLRLATLEEKESIIDKVQDEEQALMVSLCLISLHVNKLLRLCHC